MRPLVPGVVLALALGLAGCSDAEPPRTPDTGQAPTATTEPAPAPSEDAVTLAVGAAGPWAQDLWVFEYVATLDGRGGEVDLTADLMELLPGEPDATVELAHGATFDVHDVLAPWISGPDGERRTDIDTVAGVLRAPEGDAIAVLATPHPDAERPVGLDDSVEMDVSFLGDLLAPGDPLLVDYAFLQALAGEDPADTAPLELLAHRMTSGTIQYFGTQIGGVDTPLAYQGTMGVAVAGSTRTSTPAKARPMMDGFEKGVSKCRGGLGCVRQFFQKFGGGASDSNDLIRCNLSADCSDPLPPLPEPCRTANCGKVRGDPHVTTFDGLGVGMQGVGEFIAVRTADLEVQLRTEPRNESRTVSIVTAVAVQAGDTRVVVDAEDRTLRARVDGAAVPGSAGQIDLDGVSVLVLPGAVQVRHATGAVTVTHVSGRSLDVIIGLDQTDGALGAVGLMGNANGDPADDLQTREGTVIAQPVTDDGLYGEYAEAWRITAEESLFDYAAGESTETFTDRTFPDAVVTVESLPAADRARAEAVCRAAGIVEDTVLRECILDFAVTGDMGFVRSAQHADIVEGLLSGRLVAGGGDPEPDPLTVAEAWSATLGSLGGEERFAHECPAGGSLGRVWGGDGGYTDDSSICTAAVHAGLITVERGGVVQVTPTEGRDRYAASTTRNGVTTIDWDRPWGGSFTLSD